MSSNKRKISDFQKAVYAAVMSIPIGHKRSYKWVAEKAGYPGSARAVGNALHNNPFAPFVPCHRVVSSDGSLGGYNGGLKKKTRLLKEEEEYITKTASCVLRPKVSVANCINQEDFYED